MLFADLLSLRLVTFLMFFILVHVTFFLGVFFVMETLENER